MKRKIRIILLLLFLIHQPCIAQIENNTSVQLESEEIENENQEVNEEINIKRLSKMSLVEFLNDGNINSLFLNKIQLLSIQKHIENTGDILNLLELQTVANIRYEDYKRLSELIEIDEKPEFNKRKSVQFLNRSTYQSKKIENVIGSNWANYQQLKLNMPHNWNMGFAREYDIGENYSQKFYKNEYDHFAFYVQKKWKSTELSLGNYQIYQGFGLLIGQGYSSSFGNGGINNIIQQRWNANANQTEYNTMQGIILLKQYRSFLINIGISSQKIDEGTNTGLHRTLSEINKKDKITENILMVGIEQNSRSFKHSLLYLNALNSKQNSFSYATQVYYRNITAFSEFALHEQKYALSIGLAMMFGKDIQLSLSQTKFEKEYDSKWASASSQNFSKNDGYGIAWNIAFPYKRKWLVNLTYKTNSNINTNSLGTNNSNTESIRIDRKFSKNVSFTSIVLYRHKSSDGNNNEKPLTENNEFRSKFSLKQALLENLQQEIQCYVNANSNTQSKGMAYQLKYKYKYWSLIYGLGIFEINDGVPIYYTSANVISVRNTVAVYDQSAIQNIGFQTRFWKRFHFGIHYTNTYNSVERTSNYKLTTNIKYP